ncbi:BTAD domain-containing putative transcriptional regulator [Nocardia flavorosea]|uniref:BTAD domain-containing putative transcriptional regulator n=1 Tax=Nocardia flavorosea TaxID=53429 RepID=UPI0024538661|nr:BTAD domain-containing putative transcriptional regulator [Nocardia flavorosea]
MRTTAQPPLLIAVAGLSPRAGTTTTALALTHTWPGPEPALIVEAHTAGGQLAELAGVDPYLGLASLARTITPGEPIDADLLAQHVQSLPGGPALLAAPPHRDTDRALPAAQLLAGPHPNWRTLGATVFADCGIPESDSDVGPVVAAADACLIVVRADRSDPTLVARRIRALTRHSRRRGVVLVGASARGEFATALGIPLLGTLPDSRVGAKALLHGTRAPRRRPHLLPVARAIATALHHQLLTPTRRDRPVGPPARATVRPHGRNRRHQAAPPTIYRLDQAPAAPPRPRIPEPVAAEPTVRLPVPEPNRGDGEAGQHVADELPAAPEAGLDTEPADSSPVRTAQEPGQPLALALRVFGPTRIFWRAQGATESVEVTAQLQPRIRELLTVLALHPEGLSREQLIDLLWGARPPERATSALTNTLSRFRTSLSAATGGQVTGLLADDRLHYRLSDRLISVDYWDFSAAVAERRRTSSDTDQAAAARRIAELATSELASDLTESWVEALRESARRNALNALSWLATRNTENDPRATLGLLETTAESDPYNETVWQDILRLHARLGEYAALARTYSLLTHTLAEIGQTPSPETQQLLQQLRRNTK